MQTHVPNTWDPRDCRRLVLLTDNSAAWRFRAQLATKDFAVSDCRRAHASEIHDELTRLRPDLIAVSLREPQRFAPAILDYATANGRAGYCLFWTSRQQWLRGLDPQLLERLEEHQPSEYNERVALKDAIVLTRLLFMTHQEQGPICVDLVDVGTWLASGGRSARVAVKSVYITSPPERRDCAERLRHLQRKLTDVRGACFCLEGQHDIRLPEYGVALGAMGDSFPKSTINVFGIPINTSRPRGLKMRLLVGLVWLPPESQCDGLTANNHQKMCDTSCRSSTDNNGIPNRRECRHVENPQATRHSV